MKLGACVDQLADLVHLERKLLLLVQCAQVVIAFVLDVFLEQIAEVPVKAINFYFNGLLLGIVASHIDAALVKCSVADLKLRGVKERFQDLGGD